MFDIPAASLLYRAVSLPESYHRVENRVAYRV